MKKCNLQVKTACSDYKYWSMGERYREFGFSLIDLCSLLIHPVSINFQKASAAVKPNAVAGGPARQRKAQLIFAKSKEIASRYFPPLATSYL